MLCFAVVYVHVSADNVAKIQRCLASTALVLVIYLFSVLSPCICALGKPAMFFQNSSRWMDKKKM